MTGTGERTQEEGRSVAPAGAVLRDVVDLDAALEGGLTVSAGLVARPGRTELRSTRLRGLAFGLTGPVAVPTAALAPAVALVTATRLATAA